MGKYKGILKGLDFLNLSLIEQYKKCKELGIYNEQYIFRSYGKEELNVNELLNGYLINDIYSEAGSFIITFTDNYVDGFYDFIKHRTKANYLGKNKETYLNNIIEKSLNELIENDLFVFSQMSNEELQELIYPNYESFLVSEFPENFMLEYLLDNKKFLELEIFKLPKFKEYLRIKELEKLLSDTKSLLLNPINSNNSSNENWSSKRKLLLFEKVLVMDWASIETTKKSHILSVLFDKNHHNLRKASQVLAKNQDELSKYEIQDMKCVNEFLQQTLKSDLNKKLLYDLM